MKNIIGCAGQAFFGKDLLSDYLAKRLNEQGHVWYRDAFAGNVKRIYCETFGVDLEFVEEWKAKDEAPPGFDMPVRKSLQFIGDGFRQIKGSIWIDLMFRDTSKPKILSDIRYPNEFLRVKKHGGLNILIGRTNKLNDDPNGSEALIRPYCEWALRVFHGRDFVDFNEQGLGSIFMEGPPSAGEFDVFIRNDGTVEDLYRNIDKNLVPYVHEYFKEEASCPISVQ